MRAIVIMACAAWAWTIVCAAAQCRSARRTALERRRLGWWLARQRMIWQGRNHKEVGLIRRLHGWVDSTPSSGPASWC